MLRADLVRTCHVNILVLAGSSGMCNKATAGYLDLQSQVTRPSVFDFTGLSQGNCNY